MDSQEELVRLAEKVPGLNPPEMCVAVYKIVRDMQAEGDILEIGCFKGRVTVMLAKALQEKGRDKVYAIDSNLLGIKEELLGNLERFGVKEWVVPMFGHSAQINRSWRKSVKLIYSDNDLRYITRVCDFILWEPYLAVGGAIVLSHPYFPETKKFLDNYIVRSGRYQNLAIVGPEQAAVVFAYKNKETPPYPRWKIAYVQIFYTGYFMIKKLFYYISHTFLPDTSGREFAVKKKVNTFIERILRL